MTQTEHLKLIRARCVELLEIAEKRTAGVWMANENEVVQLFRGRSMQNHLLVTDEESDAAFIASCAGAAEAGWLATIVAVDTALASIDDLQGEMLYNIKMCEQLIAAWPIELLTK